MDAQTLGVVGLGKMGGPIAARLAEGGREVLGFDVAGSKATGVRSVDDLAELAAGSDVLLLSLPDGRVCKKVLEQLVEGDTGRVGVVIDLSTIGSETAVECAAILTPKEIAYVDAPVSGGVKGAGSGKMTMMASGPPEVIAPVRGLLEDIANNLFVVGDEPGLGQAMKLMNNYVSAAALTATFEAVVYGERAGLDLAQMIDVLNASSGQTKASLDKLPRAVLPRTYDFGFATASMRKDVRLYLAGADQAGVPHDLADRVDAVWQRFEDAHPDTDFTYLHKYLEEGGGA